MTKLFSLLFALCISFTVFAQKKVPSRDSVKVASIRSYIKNKKLNVPPFILDSIVDGFQKGLSGSSVKEGKLASSSLTVTDKGATVQIGFKPIHGESKKTLYLGLNISGTAADNFISVFKGGKYQNTLSTGVVVNYFPGCASGFFKPTEAWQTKQVVNKYLKQYDDVAGKDFDVKADILFINNAISDLMRYDTLLKSILDDPNVAERNMSQIQQKNLVNLNYDSVDIVITKGWAARDTLIAMGLLSKKYLDEKIPNERSALIPAKITNEDSLRTRKFLSKAEQQLMNAQWTAYSIHWLTFKPSYNVTAYQMINPEKAGDNYADSYNDNYLSFALSYNYTHRRAKGWQFQWTFSPSIAVFNSHDFSGLTKQKITKMQDMQIDGSTVSQVLFNTEGYTQVPPRKWGWNLEVPFTLFWNKHNFGVDLAARVGENNPYRDNLGGRFGIYVPIEIKEGTPIWIEPLIKVGKLGNNKNLKEGEEKLEFWKDNVEFGFNLAIAIPSLKAFSKK